MFKDQQPKKWNLGKFKNETKLQAYQQTVSGKLDKQNTSDNVNQEHYISSSRDYMSGDREDIMRNDLVMSIEQPLEKNDVRMN